VGFHRKTCFQQVVRWLNLLGYQVDQWQVFCPFFFVCDHLQKIAYVLV
jgi:hypothetical protein